MSGKSSAIAIANDLTSIVFDPVSLSLRQVDDVLGKRRLPAKHLQMFGGIRASLTSPTWAPPMDRRRKSAFRLP